MSLVVREAGRDSLEDLFFIDMFYCHFKQRKIHRSLPDLTKRE